MRFTDQMHAVYLFHGIMGFSSSLFSIFVPAYLLILGYSVREVLGYFIAHIALLCVGFFIANAISVRWGIKRTLFLHLPLRYLHVLLLVLLPSIGTPLLLLGALGGMHGALYWYPEHYLFTLYSREGSVGSQYGTLHALSSLGGALGPLIGALIAAMGGFPLLFITSITVFTFSLIPLLYAPDVPVAPFSLGKARACLRRHARYFGRLALQFTGHGVKEVIWPIIVFLALGSLLSLGILGTIWGGASVALAFLIGKMGDGEGWMTPVRLGAAAMAAVWIGYVFLSPVPSWYVLALVSGLAMILMDVPFNAKGYLLAREKDPSEFLIVREIVLDGARIAVYIVAFVFADSLAGMFWVAAGAHGLLALL